jgi:hypothetical protein
MAKGGDIRQFVLAGREFSVATECDFEITPHGYSNEFKSSGNQKMHVVQKSQLASIEGIEVHVDNSKGDAEYLKAKRDSGDAYPVNFTKADGTAWAGNMGVEEVKENTASGTAKLILRGERLEKI